MLWVYNSFIGAETFLEKLKLMDNFIDLSKVSSEELVKQSKTIIGHYSSCTIFLGFLEPGFMLDSYNQVLLRPLFRKFTVGIVCIFPESLPFSWKNEIEYFYYNKSLNIDDRTTKIIDDGGSVQHESNS